MKTFLLKDSGGQILVEMMIALGIIAITVSAAILIFFGGDVTVLDTDNSRIATDLSQNGLEAVKTIRDRNWSELGNGEHGLLFSGGQWQFSGASDSFDGFARTIMVSDYAENTKKVVSKVSWQADVLRRLEVELTSLFTDWKTIIQLDDPGDPGGGGISGDWTRPETLGSIDLGPGSEASDVDALNKIVYLSAKASAPAKSDFFVVNATNGSNPVIVSSLNTGPSLNAVDVSGDYAYVANDSTIDQLQIIDISDINDPRLVGILTFEGAGKGLTVFFQDNKVYVGTAEDDDGEEFHIVDVTDPAHPALLGSLEIEDNVNAIYVRAGYAYLASANEFELTVADVSSPTNPAIVDTLNLTGSNDGKSVWVISSKLYFGRLKGGGAELYVLDINNPLSVTVLGTKAIGANLNDLRIRDNLAFLATSAPNEEFQVWNVSDPENITLYSSLNFPQSATGIDYEDNLVYVAVRSNDALRIITSSP